MKYKLWSHFSYHKACNVGSYMERHIASGYPAKPCYKPGSALPMKGECGSSLCSPSLCNLFLVSFNHLCSEEESHLQLRLNLVQMEEETWHLLIFQLLQTWVDAMKRFLYDLPVDGRWVINFFCPKIVVSLYEDIGWLRREREKKNWIITLFCVCICSSFIWKANRGLSGELLGTGPGVSVLTGDELS